MQHFCFDMGAEEYFITNLEDGLTNIRSNSWVMV